MKFVVTGISGVIEDVPLLAQVLLEAVGGEALKVELLRRVGVRGCLAWRQYLLPLGVALRPEVGPPDVIEGIDGTVAVLKPGTEGAGGIVGIVVDVVAAKLVGNVPCTDRGMIFVSLSQGGDQLECVLAKDR